MIPATGPILTIHRSAHEIGGNCIEIAFEGHRLILDAGSQLVIDAAVPDAAAAPADLVPPTLDVTSAVDALVISHPHQDHYGLLHKLPPDWPVWCGSSAEILIRLTAGMNGGRIEQPIQNFRSGLAFTVGPFSITPYLTDHSAFDAHMLLVDVGGRRIMYSGDFRRSGRKSVLVDRMMANPPPDVDVLLLEGTALGRADAFPTEAALEKEFMSLFKRTEGRVFITWSGQNIDRTVTIYRACKRAGRPLVLDLYTLDVMERLSALYDSLPRLGWAQITGVVTSSMKRMYENPARMNRPDFVTTVATSGHAMGAAGLNATDMRNAVVMLRPSLLKDYLHKGVVLDKSDAWVFSMWSGYLEKPEYQDVRSQFESAGAPVTQIHTSGHASAPDLSAFARAIAPRHLVPIHSFTWDAHLAQFDNVLRLHDGEAFVVG